MPTEEEIKRVEQIRQRTVELKKKKRQSITPIVIILALIAISIGPLGWRITSTSKISTQPPPTPTSAAAEPPPAVATKPDPAQALAPQPLLPQSDADRYIEIAKKALVERMFDPDSAKFRDLRYRSDGHSHFDGKEVYIGGTVEDIAVHDAETLEKIGNIKLNGDQGPAGIRVMRR